MFKNVKFTNTLHTFHLVFPSQLPFLAALTSFLLTTSTVFYWAGFLLPFKLNLLKTIILHFSLYFFFLLLCAWFLMIIYESASGFHTKIVRKGLRLGVVLFIVSEIMFFFSLFWSFFHYSLSPSIELGFVWPPVGTQKINVWGLPFTNTVLLLSSGITITLAHHAIKKNDAVLSFVKFINYLGATILLGLAFLLCQWIEYKYGLRFRWNDNVYGSIFFITTGFHGFHVLLGTYGLLFCLMRTLLTYENTFLFKFRFSKTHHIGFEAALWYWHFVDVVWIFLFGTIYWWGSANF